MSTPRRNEKKKGFNLRLTESERDRFEAIAQVARCSRHQLILRSARTVLTLLEAELEDLPPPHDIHAWRAEVGTVPQMFICDLLCSIRLGETLLDEDEDVADEQED